MNDDADRSIRIPRPKFDPVLNFGHVLTAITIASGIAALLFKISGWQVATDMSLLRLDNELLRINQRSEKYTPLIDKMVGSNDIQDERISRQADFLAEQRKLNNELLSKLGEIQSDLAVIKAREDIK